MKWAPNSTKSILQEYTKQVCLTPLFQHSGLTLAFNSVLYTNDIFSNKKEDCRMTDTSHFVSILCLRNKYSGEISGLISTINNEEKSSLNEMLLNEIWNSCKMKLIDKHKSALWRATAFLIQSNEFSQSLLHAIATSQVDFFNKETVETAIEMWKWIITARTDLELCLIQEMATAWQATYDKKMGLFTLEQETTSPLAAYDGCKDDLLSVDVEPHLIWLNFLSELVDTAKYYNSSIVEIFCSLLHRCLPLNKTLTQTRNVLTVGCRFKLLQCGLSILQGNTIGKSLSRNILRERIYYYALDYFCSQQMCPHQNKAQLLEDIQILMKFWQTMRSEKKHLTTTEINEYETNHNATLGSKSTSEMLSISGGEIARSGSTSLSGWYNTLPHSTSTLSKKSLNRSKRLVFAKDAYDKDYMKKRNLILELLAAELEFLIIWYNPLSSLERQIAGEEAIMEWRTRPTKNNLWREYTKLAWNYNPALAVFLPQR